METCVYENLNKAEREKDSSKVWSLGPFSFALGEITTYS